MGRLTVLWFTVLKLFSGARPDCGASPNILSALPRFAYLYPDVLDGYRVPTGCS